MGENTLPRHTLSGAGGGVLCSSRVGVRIKQIVQMHGEGGGGVLCSSRVGVKQIVQTHGKDGEGYLSKGAEDVLVAGGGGGQINMVL